MASLLVRAFNKDNMGSMTLPEAAHGLAFITSPHYAQLYQCACCQKFFVNVRRRRNTKYCSVRCAHSDTAVKATREKYQRKRQDKLSRINAAIADLATRED